MEKIEAQQCLISARQRRAEVQKQQRKLKKERKSLPKTPEANLNRKNISGNIRAKEIEVVALSQRIKYYFSVLNGKEKVA